ncbi:Rho guanine nucleotide exchange factor [Malassezia sp. CBS 17886]|nr:Rho guanine nucleotide exchange factor [Malassezia sp. CBS 17886]
MAMERTGASDSDGAPQDVPPSIDVLVDEINDIMWQSPPSRAPFAASSGVGVSPPDHVAPMHPHLNRRTSSASVASSSSATSSLNARRRPLPRPPSDSAARTSSDAAARSSPDTPARPAIPEPPPKVPVRRPSGGSSSEEFAGRAGAGTEQRGGTPTRHGMQERFAREHKPLGYSVSDPHSRSLPRRPRASFASDAPRSPSEARRRESVPERELRAGVDIRRNDTLLRGAASTRADIHIWRLSHLARLLHGTLERRPLIKGSIVYPLGFTGRTAVNALVSIIAQFVAVSSQFGGADEPTPRRLNALAMNVARSLKTQLFLHEADWEDHPLTDGVEEVYMFFSDSAAGDRAVAHAACDAVPRAPELFARGEAGVVLRAPVAAALRRAAPNQEPPTGVVTPLTPCYSPLCALSPDGAGCYVPSCPRGGRTWQAVGDEDSGTHMDPGVGATAWVETMPRDLIAALPRAVVERQNAIHEFVQKEEAFLRDLQLLGTFAARLRRTADAPPVGIAPPLAGAALDEFCAVVFGNCMQLQAHITAFVDRLHERQREEFPLVQGIGDVCLDAVLEWGDAYIAYVEHYPIALDRLKREVAANARMRQFVDDCRRDPAAHRHPLDNFLFRTPARLQRYHLHLASVCKYTDEKNDDRAQLGLVMEIVDEQCKAAQTGVEAAERQLQLREFASLLAAKRLESHVVRGAARWHSPQNMDLMSPARTLVHHAPVYRRPDGFEFDWTPLVAVLFDNYLVLAKRKRAGDARSGDARAGGTDADDDDTHAAQLVVSRRPIPVLFLDAAGWLDAPLSRGHLNRHLLPAHMSDVFPFTVRHRYARRDPLTLYVASADERSVWQAKTTGVIAAARARTPALARRALSDDALGAATEVTCATAFALDDGTRLVALGSVDGVWIGLRGEPHSLRQVLHLRGVTQCAVLAPLSRFLVLADRTLVAYDLAALVPSRERRAAPDLAPLRVSGAHDVLFFSVGCVFGRDVLVYAKRKSSETSMRLLEPVVSAPPPPDKSRWRARRPAALTGFRVVQKFYVQADAGAAQFLDERLVVCSARGIQVFRMAAETLDVFPQPTPGVHDDLQRATESARALAVFRVDRDTLLLCYDRCACFVDMQGHVVHAEQAFEWEGRIVRAAVCAGYVLGFCDAFAEVRRLADGQLVDALEGADLRLLSRSDWVDDMGAAVLIAERVRSRSGMLVQHVEQVGEAGGDGGERGSGAAGGKAG